MDESKYNQLADSLKPKKHILKNTINAFLFGGIIGMIGQFILELYQNIFSLNEKDAGPLMIITLIFIAAVLTGLGVFDRLANIGGAGTFIPITGFSNAMTSCALEGKSEGLVTGIGSSIFKLGGAVITFGIVASFILGGLRYVLSFFW